MSLNDAQGRNVFASDEPLGSPSMQHAAAGLLATMADGMALSILNKIGGAVVGALKFALIMSVVIFVLDAIEQSYPLVSFKAKEGSLLYKPVGKIAPTLIPALNKSKVAALLPKADDVGVDVDVKLKLKDPANEKE